MTPDESGHFGHSTHTIFRYFLRYFSRLRRTNFSQIPQDLSPSCDPVGFAIFANRQLLRWFDSVVEVAPASEHPILVSRTGFDYTAASVNKNWTSRQRSCATWLTLILRIASVTSGCLGCRSPSTPRIWTPSNPKICQSSRSLGGHLKKPDRDSEIARSPGAAAGFAGVFDRRAQRQ
jgi:hypothetical protein